MIDTEYDDSEYWVVKILFFFEKFGKNSGGNENKGIPFILCSLIEKQRNSL